MNMNQIIAAIKELSTSQGFYCRLYNAIIELKNADAVKYAELAQHLEAQHFGDVVDMVLYFEC